MAFSEKLSKGVLFLGGVFLILCLVFSALVNICGATGPASSPPKPAEITIDPAKTALLLLHFQNDLMTPGGKFVRNLPERVKAAHNVEHTQAVLKASREKGMLIVHVRAAWRPGVPEFGPKTVPLIHHVVEAKAVTDGTWGAEVIDELKPAGEDVVVINTSTSAFCNNDLDMILRNNGITDVVLTGMVTNFVVESTCREAINRGYFAYILKDCINSWSDDFHNWPLNNILPNLAILSESKAYISALKD